MCSQNHTVERFSERASGYDQHRWPFDQRLVPDLIAELEYPGAAIVADIGCGTGLSSALIATEVKQVFAIEPSDAMRNICARRFRETTSVQCLAGWSHATGMPANCIDLLLAGRAMHWFDPEPTRHEFLRITKPPHRLAILRTPCTDPRLIEPINTLAGNYRDPNRNRKSVLDKRIADFFFADNSYATFEYPAIIKESWDDFYNRNLSFSYAPKPDQPSFTEYRQALADLFEQHAEQGTLAVSMKTELLLGNIDAT